VEKLVRFIQPSLFCFFFGAKGKKKFYDNDTRTDFLLLIVEALQSGASRTGFLQMICDKNLFS